MRTYLRLLPLLVSSSSLFAAGFQVTPHSLVAFLDQNDFISAGFRHVNAHITANQLGGSSVLKSFTTPNFMAKSSTFFNDVHIFGQYYEPYLSNIIYGSSTTLGAYMNTEASLRSNAFTLAMNYAPSFAQGLSVSAGAEWVEFVKNSKLKPGPLGLYTIQSGKIILRPMYGIGYSYPALGIKAHATFLPAVSHRTKSLRVESSLLTLNNGSLNGNNATFGDIPYPRELTLEGQMGLSPTTLLSLMYNYQSWSNAQAKLLFPAETHIGNAEISSPYSVSDFNNGHQFQGSLSQAISHNWAVTLGVHYDKKGDPASTSLLSVQNGAWTYGVGLTYMTDLGRVTSSVSRISFGDRTVTFVPNPSTNPTTTSTLDFNNNYAVATDIHARYHFPNR